MQDPYPNRDAPEDALEDVLRNLWAPPPGHSLAGLVPRRLADLPGHHQRMGEFLRSQSPVQRGTIEPGALVAGQVVHLGEGAVIEAGAVITASCRLYLGAGSRVRAGAVLRDDVIVGAECLIGVHCEVARSVLLGPGTLLGHANVVLDSIVGSDSLLSGGILIANTALRPGAMINLRVNRGTVGSGRSHLGALIGDGVRMGAGTTMMPGSILCRGVVVPAGAVVLGTVDDARSRELTRQFWERWGD